MYRRGDPVGRPLSGTATPRDRPVISSANMMRGVATNRATHRVAPTTQMGRGNAYFATVCPDWRGAIACGGIRAAAGEAGGAADEPDRGDDRPRLAGRSAGGGRGCGHGRALRAGAWVDGGRAGR